MTHSATATWVGGRSQGWLRTSNGPQYFDAPLISHITGNLYVGGCNPAHDLGNEFQTVVSLYPWEQYPIGDAVLRVEVKMYDGPSGVDEDDLFRASEATLYGLRTGKTLVHCQAGINRSNLVAAYTLMRQGYSANRAIDLLREKRHPLVLSNQHFVEQLLGL